MADVIAGRGLHHAPRFGGGGSDSRPAAEEFKFNVGRPASRFAKTGRAKPPSIKVKNREKNGGKGGEVACLCQCVPADWVMARSSRVRLAGPGRCFLTVTLIVGIAGIAGIAGRRNCQRGLPRAGPGRAGPAWWGGVGPREARGLRPRDLAQCARLKVGSPTGPGPARGPAVEAAATRLERGGVAPWRYGARWVTKCTLGLSRSPPLAGGYRTYKLSLSAGRGGAPRHRGDIAATSRRYRGGSGRQCCTQEKSEEAGPPIALSHRDPGSPGHGRRG